MDNLNEFLKSLLLLVLIVIILINMFWFVFCRYLMRLRLYFAMNVVPTYTTRYVICH